MSFQPVLPMSGIAGWNYLNRTLDTQLESFRKTPLVQRDAEYFQENITRVKTAGDLVSDRRLLRVALGAFGLDDDINSRAFIRRVLEDGSEDRKALANRLADKRYLQLTKAFGFDRTEGPETRTEGFAEQIIAAFENRQFEVAVGQQDESMRLALNMRRELADIAGSDRSDRAKWFTVLGSPPLRSVFEGAFGLPDSFGRFDLEQQLSVLQRRTRQLTGDSSVSQFSDPTMIERLADRYMIQAQVQAAMNSFSGPGAIALQLLQAP